MKNRIRLLTLFILLLLIGGTAVGLSDIGKLCIFSAISGTITLNGEPVANAKLIRTGSKERKHTDETTTDEKGYFSFPAMYERSVAKFLPMEFVASQKITVKYQGKSYKLWTGVKRKPEENAESRGKPLDVHCALNSDELDIAVDGSIFFTLCTWGVEPDQPVNMDNPFEPGT